jgi:nicotinamide-nucleotide amidase
MALAALRAAGLKVALAESCTGGMVCAALTDIPGSSDVVERGFVTYSNAAKTDLLGVSPDLIERFGAVSEPVARAMAEGALAASPAAVAVSVTGIAGPGGSAFTPEGLVHFACARRGAPIVELRREFGALGRARVRDASVDQALDLLIAAAKAADAGAAGAAASGGTPAGSPDETG